MVDFYTVTKEGKPIFAALHLGQAEPTDRCMTLAVAGTATTIEPHDTRSLATTLLRASDILEQGKTQ